jgi:hypothetical protein
MLIKKENRKYDIKMTIIIFFYDNSSIIYYLNLSNLISNYLYFLNYVDKNCIILLNLLHNGNQFILNYKLIIIIKH